MRTCHRIAFPALDMYYTFYGGHEIDTDVGSGRQRRFLDTDLSSAQRFETCF
jgi:hypothetical protein